MTSKGLLQLFIWGVAFAAQTALCSSAVQDCEAVEGERIGEAYLGEKPSKKFGVTWYAREHEFILCFERNRDFMEIMSVGANAGLTMAIGTCMSNGVLDQSIFALARRGEEDEFASLLNIWKFDIDSERVVEISSAGVTCFDY